MAVIFLYDYGKIKSEIFKNDTMPFRLLIMHVTFVQQTGDR